MGMVTIESDRMTPWLSVIWVVPEINVRVMLLG